MRIVPLLLTAVLVAGCDDDDITDGDDEIRWTATLEARAAYAGVGGTGFAVTDDGRTTASVTLTGAAANVVYPWHVHLGTCATGGPIVGDPAAYPFLEPGTDGEDTQTATIDVALLTTQSYFINVHDAPDDLDTIVACGDLERT